MYHFFFVFDPNNFLLFFYKKKYFKNKRGRNEINFNFFLDKDIIYIIGRFDL